MDPNRRLRKLSVEKTGRAMDDLEAALQDRTETMEGITATLQSHLSGDVNQLREALEQKVAQRLEEATGKLIKRADEEGPLCAGVGEQRRRITSTCSRTDENLDQLLLDLGEVKAERRQLESNRNTTAASDH